jgi:hypothetical protein
MHAQADCSFGHKSPRPLTFGRSLRFSILCALSLLPAFELLAAKHLVSQLQVVTFEVFLLSGTVGPFLVLLVLFDECFLGSPTFE